MRRYAALAARQGAARPGTDSRTPRRHTCGGGPDESAVARLVGQAGEYALVGVTGVVDIASRGALTEVLTDAVACDAPALVVDLSRVILLAAAGFHSLDQAAQLLAERGGRLHLACPTGSSAARVLRLLDPDGAWPVHVDVHTAVATVTKLS
jgi:anti-anti-sigma regulatory factor